MRRERTHRRLVVALIRRFLRVATLHLLDAAIVAGAVWAMVEFVPTFADARPYLPAIVVVFLVGLNSFAAYRSGDARRDGGRLFSGIALALLLLGALTVVPPALPLEPLFLLVLGVICFGALAAGRFGVDQVVRQAYKRGIGLRRAVIIGTLDEVADTIQQLRDDRNIDQYLVGHITPDDHPDPASLGVLRDARQLLDELDVEEVILTASLSPREVHDVSELCFDLGAALYVVPAPVASSELRTEPTRIGDCTVVRLHPARLELPALLIKRAFDVTVAALLLLLLSPLMVLVAVALKLDSPGPVFYRSRRIGLGGRPFYMWKFRSMRADAAEREGEVAHLNIYSSGAFKIPNDPRVTRVGAVLRRTSMDELPQLFNVLAGDMSLVGPRPSLETDVTRYESHHFERLTVIPGMTGPWQVSGRNLITDFDQIVRLERAYIRSWSLVLDAKILMRTLKVVVRGDGAY